VIALLIRNTRRIASRLMTMKKTISATAAPKPGKVSTPLAGTTNPGT
jgi:hypothetical protein